MTREMLYNVGAGALLDATVVVVTVVVVVPASAAGGLEADFWDCRGEDELNKFLKKLRTVVKGPLLVGVAVAAATTCSVAAAWAA